MTTANLQTDLSEQDVYTLLRRAAERVFNNQAYQQALGLWRSCYFTAKEMFGFYSQSTASSAENVARTLVYLGRFDDALSWWKLAYFVNRQNMGVEHESTVRIALEAAECYTRVNRHGEALVYWVAALPGCQKYYGKFNFTTVGCLYGLINSHARHRHHEQAIELGLQALADYQTHGPGVGRPGDWLNIARVVAESLSAKGRYFEAAEIWSLHLKMLEDFDRNTFEKALPALDSRASCLENAGKLWSAFYTLDVCIQISASLFGDDAERTVVLKRRRDRLAKMLA